MAYDVSVHALLSDKAKSLFAKQPAAFAEQQELAVNLLGLTDTSFTGSKLAIVNRAIVMQLNYQLELSPSIFLHKQASSSQSRQNVTYRDNIGLLYQPAAALLTSAGVTGSWGNITSVRRSVR